MAANNNPFEPTSQVTVGNTIAVIASGSSAHSVVNCTGNVAPTLLVTNNGSVLIFARISLEAVPVATAADVPIPPATGYLFANPSPSGITGVAAISSTSASCSVYFTPGIGQVIH